jgi:hypothetical protein
MAEIMKTRLESGVVETEHACFHPEPLKLMVRIIMPDSLSEPRA